MFLRASCRPVLRLARSSGLRRSLSSSSSLPARGAIDVHTHVYLPAYMETLRSRTSVPYVRRIAGEDRLVILPGEDEEATTAVGRPIGPEYHEIARKLEFMDRHGIQSSVISLANPWLDFLSAEEAPDVARRLNDELEGTESSR